MRKKLRRSISDLPGGRGVLWHIHPFMACELQDEFSFEKAIKYGLVPMIWQSESPE